MKRLLMTNFGILHPKPHFKISSIQIITKSLRRIEIEHEIEVNDSNDDSDDNDSYSDNSDDTEPSTLKVTIYDVKFMKE